MDARFSSGHLEYSACPHSGYCADGANAGVDMDVRHEPEQHQHIYRDLVPRRRNLRQAPPPPSQPPPSMNNVRLGKR